MAASRPGSASAAAGRLVLWRERKSMVGSPVSAGPVTGAYPATPARPRRGRQPMIAVAAHTDTTTRAQIAGTLERAGWIVFQTTDADHAIRLCREQEADVLLIGERV